MKYNSTLSVAILTALLVTGTTIISAAPQTPATRPSEHRQSQRNEQKARGEQNKRGEADERNEQGEAGEAEQAKLQSEARITKEQAQAIALKHTAGNIESGELEREHGKLVYSFDIRTDKDITEVQVNAVNGKIERVEHENAQQEAAEKRKEEREQQQRNQRKP